MISFIAKWNTKIVNATLQDGAWGYSVNELFIPVNEVSKPYYLDHLSDGTAQRVLHGSTAVDLLQAYNGINLNLSPLVIEQGRFVKRFFNIEGATATTPDVVDGDSLLILTPIQEQ